LNQRKRKFSDEEDRIMLKIANQMKGKNKKYSPLKIALWETVKNAGVIGLHHREPKVLLARYKNKLKDSRLGFKNIPEFALDNLHFFIEKEEKNKETSTNKSTTKAKNQEDKEMNENIMSDDPITQNPSIFDTPGKDRNDEIEDSQEKSKEYGTNHSLRESLQKQKPTSRSPSPRHEDSSSRSSKNTPNKGTPKRKLDFNNKFDDQAPQDFQSLVESFAEKYEINNIKVIKAFYVCGGKKKKVEKYLENKNQNRIKFFFFSSFFFFIYF
jgi:hypothetical protein